MIVTQKFLGEDTSHLENDAPLTWQYLKKNSALFAKRKSRIYDNAAEFAIFGIGDYSYLPYKVCIGGFNKKPIFSLAFSMDKKPVMLDDTSYFIGFENYEMAYVAMIYLNSAKVQGFLQNHLTVKKEKQFILAEFARVVSTSQIQPPLMLWK